MKKIKPAIAWVGGKTRLVDKLISKMPEKYDVYYEPFVGAGSLLFALQPKRAYVNDNNEELINMYSVIEHNIYGLQQMLELFKHLHDDKFYYRVRSMDRVEGYKDKFSMTMRAARFMYLNKMTFNGLYRVNQKGYFNAPLGKKEIKCNVINDLIWKNLYRVHAYLTTSCFDMSNKDYSYVLYGAYKGDFVYFDPPYDSEPGTTSFVAYNKDGFGQKEQKELAELCHKLTKKGVKFMLSNANTKLINELYKDYNIEYVNVRRSINSSVGAKSASEVIITNYVK